MSEIRWRLRHPNKDSAIEEWQMSRRQGSGTYVWVGVSVRWFPLLKKWRVMDFVKAGVPATGRQYLKHMIIAEFPCDPLVRDFIGEEARAFAEITWRLKHGE